MNGIPQYYSGDTLPPLSGQCLNNNTPVSGSGSTAEAHVIRPDGSVLVSPITLANDGTWTLDWDPGDLNQPGSYSVEVQVTFPAGGIQTFGRSVFVVSDQIA